MSTQAGQQTVAEVIYEAMSAPGFAIDNDGYALPSEIARTCRRNLYGVQRALRQGQDAGLFTSRPHASRINTTTGEPLTEYKAL